MKREALVVTFVGINQRTAPVEGREKVAFSAEELPDALARLQDELGSAVVLSTCNRTELYTTTQGDVADMERLVDALGACKAARLGRRRPYFLDHDEAGG